MRNKIMFTLLLSSSLIFSSSSYANSLQEKNESWDKYGHLVHKKDDFTKKQYKVSKKSFDKVKNNKYGIKPEFVNRMLDSDEMRSIEGATEEEKIAGAIAWLADVISNDERNNRKKSSVFFESKPVKSLSYFRHIPEALMDGDIFYEEAGSGGVNYGHVGIYIRLDTIVEAPGTGKISHEVHIRQKEYSSSFSRKRVDDCGVFSL